MNPRIPLLLIGLAATFAPWTQAATVEVRVVDQAGGDAERVEIRLTSAAPVPLANPGAPAVFGGKTDGSGLVYLDGVPPGPYRLTAITDGTDFVAPENNPLAPPVSLTVRDAAAVVQARLELHRGTPLCLRFSIDRSWRTWTAPARLREQENGFRTEVALRQDEERCVPLFAGRWEVGLDPPNGYLLTAVELNGRPIDGAKITLDVRPGDQAQYLDWHLVAPSRVVGRVTFAGDRFPVQVVAQLIQPGPWIDAVRARGGSDFEAAAAGVDPRSGLYTMDLPDGVWAVAPQGDGLEASEPESEEVDLAQGSEARVDFHVWGDSGGGTSLLVFVVGLDRLQVDEAVVELWPLDPAERDAEPFARAVADSRRPARFRDVVAGDYLIVAGDGEHREGQLALPGYDPENDRRWRRVFLRQGGRLNVVFAPEDAARAAGAEIRLDIDGDGPEMVLRDPTVVERARHPRGVVDATGEAWIHGIHPGSYRLTGSLASAYVRFEGDDGVVEETLLTFEDEEAQEVLARVVPAASITGTLYCKGGEALPSNVALRVLPSEARPEDPLDTAWLEAVELAEDRVVLRGDERNRFRLGPLEPSSWIVAVRPASFDRWTWAFGTEDGSAAGSFETASEAVDLGAIGVECGPALRVVPITADGAPLPDLEDVSPRRETFNIAGEIRPPGGAEERIHRADVESYRRLLLVRGLPEGDASLTLSLGHRYFLPGFWVEVPVIGELTRGRTLDVPVQLPSVGGAIEIGDPAGRAAAVRIRAGDDAPRTVPLKDRRALIGNLPPGSYSFASCADPACETLIDERADVQVRESETTTIVLATTASSR